MRSCTCGPIVTCATTSLRTKINHLHGQPPLCWAHGKAHRSTEMGAIREGGDSESPVMEFRMLGPVEVRAGGSPIALGEPRQRAVLVALLVDAGRPVSVETLVDRVWGEAPPPQARRSLQAH